MRFVYRHRRLVLVLSIVAAALSFPLAGQAPGVLSSGGWLVTGSELARVADRLSADFGQGKSSLIVLFKSTDGARADSPDSLAKIRASADSFAADPNVQAVYGYESTGGDERFLSFDGSATYLLVLLKTTDEGSIDIVPELRVANRCPTRSDGAADRLRAARRRRERAE